ncbi:hypothetical protein J6590_006966 [Homalodisca vitripennis]|nr:hypothetical protein J6590_006965 [Homalodisca vitripennis]KAG8307986.1 hypothetical protein J6590_006966 [Homalodisca vitripennis]
MLTENRKLTEVGYRDCSEWSSTNCHQRTDARIRNKFEADGTVHNVNKKPYGHLPVLEMKKVREVLLRSPPKSLGHTARDTRISKGSVYRMCTFSTIRCQSSPRCSSSVDCGHKDPIEYPARFPDLTLMDFFL